MIAWWQDFSQRALVAHLLRAVERFNLRGGAQLAAAISYFSTMSLVPVLMFAFSGLGLTLTVFRPGALSVMEEWITERLPPDDPLAGQIVSVITSALHSWATIGLIGLGVGMWIGSGWIGNLKRAVRVLMRTNVDRPGKQLPLPLDVLTNFVGLVFLLLAVAATFLASATASSLGSLVGQALGIGDSVGWSLLLRVVSLLVSLAAGTALFWALYAWFTPHPLTRHLHWIGSLIGSAGLLVLQLLASVLISAFSRNLSAALFGPVIILMLFLNLFATLILFIAAWLATDRTAEQDVPEVVPETSEPQLPEPQVAFVSAEVARRSMGVGLGAGYAIGAATGLGLGALIVGGLRALVPSRKGR